MGRGKKKLVKDGRSKCGKESHSRLSTLRNELKSLEFHNPGPHFQAYYQNIPRKRGKVQGAPVAPSVKSSDQFLAVYNHEGLLSVSSQDLCDCISQTCPGCHFPCLKCGSTKCGVECRCNRKWQYINKEVDGNFQSCLSSKEVEGTILIPLDNKDDFLLETNHH